jgi:ubiquitin-like-conjugating enzyme ATG3
MEEAALNDEKNDDEDEDDEEAADMEAFEESGMLDDEQVCN